MWNECSRAVVWTFFGIALLGFRMKAGLFQSCGLCWWDVHHHIETKSSYRRALSRLPASHQACLRSWAKITVKFSRRTWRKIERTIIVRAHNWKLLAKSFLVCYATISCLWTSLDPLVHRFLAHHYPRLLIPTGGEQACCPGAWL